MDQVLQAAVRDKDGVYRWTYVVTFLYRWDRIRLAAIFGTIWITILAIVLTVYTGNRVCLFLLGFAMTNIPIYFIANHYIREPPKETYEMTADGISCLKGKRRESWLFRDVERVRTDRYQNLIEMRTTDRKTHWVHLPKEDWQQLHDFIAPRVPVSISVEE